MSPEQSDVERQELMSATASLIDDHLVEGRFYLAGRHLYRAVGSVRGRAETLGRACGRR
jgi:hypothetical protein